VTDSTFLGIHTGSFSTPAAGNPTVVMVEAAYRHHGLDVVNGDQPCLQPLPEHSGLAENRVALALQVCRCDDGRFAPALVSDENRDLCRAGE
jgi:hypothetical protein